MRLFSKSDLRFLSAILAFAIFLSSAPLSVGVVIRPGSHHPEITNNICSPLRSFQVASNILLARPAIATAENVLGDLGAIVEIFNARLIELHIAPVTPPPEALV